MGFIAEKIKRYSLLILASALVLANVLTFAPQVFATSLTKPEVILTNMQQSGTTDVIVYFQTSATNTGTTLTVTFPAGFTLTPGAQTLSGSYSGTTCIAMTGATVNLPGTPTATASGQVVTFSGLTGGFAISTKYCEVITTAVTNPSSAASYTVAVAAGTDASANTSVSVISTSDQVAVTATVPSAFSFALSSNAVTFGTLSTGAIGSTGVVTATVSTNGTGWTIYGFDSNGGLNSASTGHTIFSSTPGSPYTVIAGTEGYVTAINSAQTVVAAYANPTFSTSGLGSGLNTTVTKLVSGAVPVSGATAQFEEFAGISGTTNAATDYTDTITLLGAGSF